MKKIRIGQIGIGHNHGEAKMQAVRKFPELFEVVGYAEPSDYWIRERGENAGYAGLARMTEEELLAKCDAILVETDVWDLTETAERCVRAGKHIHMDKPASGTLEDYKRVLDIAEQKGLVVQLGYMYRYNPAILKTLEAIREGRLGEIYSINAEMSTYHPANYKKWLKNFGGGIMYILGSHMVDLIVYMLGKPNKVHSFLKHTGLDGVDAEDNNLSVLEYDKALARIFVSSVEVNGYGRRQLVIAGSRGTANICPMEKPTVMTWADTSMEGNPYADVKTTIPFDFSIAHRYDEMMRDFHAYVLGEKQNPFSYEHDYLVQRVLSEVVGGLRFHGKHLE